jgi:hypothetical protein
MALAAWKRRPERLSAVDMIDRTNLILEVLLVMWWWYEVQSVSMSGLTLTL